MRYFLRILALSVFLLPAVSAPRAYASEKKGEHPTVEYPSPAEDKNFGLGVVLGEPTGLSGNLWVTPLRSVDMGLAYSFNSYVLLSADYLFHFKNMFRKPTEFVRELLPYVGVGGYLIFTSGNYHGIVSSTGFGVRVPLGIEWMPHAAPLGVFVEAVPGIGLVPSTYAFLQGGIGIRFYF